MNLRDSENTLILGGFLGVVALCAALTLAYVSGVTYEPIKKAQQANRREMLTRLGLPDFNMTGREVSCGEYTFFAVYDQTQCVGFVGQGSTRGYGGEIMVVTGFDANGKITGVQILKHRETPGLGAGVCERKFQRSIFNLTEKAPEIPRNEYLDQFNGLNADAAGNWKIAKDGGDFIYRTGATVTGRAVTELINSIAVNFSGSKSAIREKSTL